VLIGVKKQFVCKEMNCSNSSEYHNVPGSATSERNCTPDDSLGSNDYHSAALTHVRRIYITSYLNLQICS